MSPVLFPLSLILSERFLVLVFAEVDPRKENLTHVVCLGNVRNTDREGKKIQEKEGHK